MNHIKGILRKSELFKTLTEAELDKITGLCKEEVYEPGATIIMEGEQVNRLYIVKEGRVAVEMTLRFGTGPGRIATVDVITKGQTFGWWGRKSYALIESMRCIEKTKVLAVDGLSLWRLLEKNTRIGHKVMKRRVGVISFRLVKTRDTLAHILSIASHDLKSPLAAVESYHKVMLDGYAGEITEKQKTMLLRSSERIKGLLNLIDNILDISRIDARELKMEATSLLKVVEDVRGVIEPLAEGKGLKLEVEVPKDLPLIAGSPERLQQVFNNLLGNAVKFTLEGGTVTLKVSEADDHILVEIIDTGIGISPEELPKIFTDFFRGIRVDSTGAGLGLGISKRIIEAHRGKIWAESPCPESGVGSKFTFTLPKNLATIRGE